MTNANWQFPQEIHLELTSFCQASCPGCSRMYDYAPHLENHIEPTQWSLSQLQKVFDPILLSQIKSLLLCGNYGDPLMFDPLADWLEEIVATKPQLEICIHTNAGVGSLQTWQRLGKLLSRPGHLIKFSIDGLEDTNELYRRGVKWERVRNNVETFIQNGGRAVWKYIIFPHNQHQVEQAKQLSQLWGFRRFETRLPYEPERDLTTMVQPQELPFNLQTDFRELSTDQLQAHNFQFLEGRQEISCRALNERSLYMDADRRLWPCCWLSQDGNHRTRTTSREDFFRKVFDLGIDRHFNSLEHHTLQEILIHPFFTNLLPESWKKESIQQKKCFPTCLKACSQSF